MANLITARSTHSGKLERYLGKDEVERISSSMTAWHGTRPILVGNVPSTRGVWVGRGGDFVGRIDGGGFAGLAERCVERTRQALDRVARRTAGRMSMAGFTSLSDLINEATLGGKKADYQFNKVGTAGVISVTNSLWRVGAQPAAGAAPSNAPGGNVPTNATTGALLTWNPTTVGDTQHFVRADVLATVAANTLLMYDRIFEVNKTMNSTATETVTGVPTRYQAVTNTPDAADGNFLFFETQTALAATAHNWNATYTDHDGNAGIALPTLTGNASAIINRLDHPVGQFFAPLAAGDAGIQKLESVTCSALVATGAIACVIGHPIAFLPMPVANMLTIVDGINTAFNLTRIFDNAALGFLEVCKPSATATTYTGNISTVAG
jgi:hypothetical protein